jgi:hypothetical protein
VRTVPRCGGGRAATLAKEEACIDDGGSDRQSAVSMAAVATDRVESDED